MPGRRVRRRCPHGHGKVRPQGEVGDGGDASSQVAWRIPVGAELLQAKSAAADTGLLPELPQCPGAQGLVLTRVAARQPGSARYGSRPRLTRRTINPSLLTVRVLCPGRADRSPCGVCLSALGAGACAASCCEVGGERQSTGGNVEVPPTRSPARDEFRALRIASSAMRVAVSPLDPALSAPWPPAEATSTCRVVTVLAV